MRLSHRARELSYNSCSSQIEVQKAHIPYEKIKEEEDHLDDDPHDIFQLTDNCFGILQSSCQVLPSQVDAQNGSPHLLPGVIMIDQVTGAGVIYAIAHKSTEVCPCEVYR